MIFDIHAHYDDEKFNEDRETVLENMNKENVKYIINSGVDIETSLKSIQFAEKYEFIYATVGVYPGETDKVPADWLNKLETMLENEKVVGIGEIGLDYYYEEVPRETQMDAFKKQILLAQKHNLPIVIHDRDAHGDTLEILKSMNVNKGVMHCFSGSKEFANEIINLGMYISIGGVITFKNAKKLVEVACNIPLEKIVLETDCPYLAPTPFRGQRNYSPYIKYVVEKIAQIKGVTESYVEEITMNNAIEIFMK